MSDPVAAADATTANKPKKKKLVNRPPAVKKPSPGGPNSKKNKKGAGVARESGFPIPLSFLYRDPRPSPRRNAGGGDYSQGGMLDDPDAEGLPIKDTPEQIREKKTLYAANMAQAQAFLSQLRYTDARIALNKVRPISSTIVCHLWPPRTVQNVARPPLHNGHTKLDVSHDTTRGQKDLVNSKKK